jgi:hypothetical protein
VAFAEVDPDEVERLAALTLETLEAGGDRGRVA